MNIKMLNNLVGMEKPKQLIIEAATVCEHENGRFPHTLIVGNSGCGKTMLARTIADMLDSKMREYHGRSLTEDKSIISHLLIAIRNLNPKVNAILFIDEVHQLKPIHQEMLFPIMEKPNVTLIAATTDTGKLVKPLQNRFGLTIYASDYSIEESEEIIVRYCKKNDIPIDNNAVSEIAQKGRGTPRIICEHVDRCFNKAKFISIQELDKECETRITKEIAQLTFSDLEIGENGLTVHEHKILKILTKNNILAVKTLCSMAEIDKEQFEKNYEPYLIKLGLIEKSPRGRKITDSGIEYTSMLYQEFSEW